ncbi:MAG: peptidyl-prolyl cis-trans isomerase [Flavobacteriales bacterium]|nr:peptidyl-prolyl cis-trans isomerase [Flavobacteriales bacterium]
MKKISLILFIGILSISVKAQEKDPVLLTINKKEVLLSEFNAIFNKNNTNEGNATEKAVNEYLDLYIKFKLKVTEAEELGYDTTKAFLGELEGYRKQLIQPYLSDREVTENLIKEAYERMKMDVKASHILFMVGPDASPKDTLAAYNKAMKARARIMKGESFDKVAKEVSEDPSAKSNAGDLGYFSALHMVYPFESAAYNLKVGELSMPVRTRFGYHILKVTDKRPARGTMRAAHIMIACKKDADSLTLAQKEQKVKEIYEKLKNDPSQFKDLAKQHSDDKQSGSRGGELAPFGTGKMVPEFEEAAFALKTDGEISAPIRSDFGFHIIQRLELTELDSYENLYNSLKSRVSRDSRANKSKEVVINRIKAENNFKENLAERNDFYKAINPKEWTEGSWSVDRVKSLNKVMFGFYANDGEKLEYTQQEFAERMAMKQPKGKLNANFNLDEEINKEYNNAVEEKALEFKELRLPKTNMEYKLLLQEYRDGILLFDLTDEKVWSKAIKDTTGLQNFYETNKNNYMWNERVDVTIYKCNNETVASQVEKILKKKAKKGYTNDDILKMVNTDSQLALNIEEGKFEKGQNELVDACNWEKGTTQKVNDKAGKTVNWVIVNEVLKPEAKKLNEVRGTVTSDYQNFLEKEWVNELKNKYEVVVNKEVLKLVK